MLEKVSSYVENATIDDYDAVDELRILCKEKLKSL